MVPPHSPVLTMIGASMLWVGWFGFNGGSALAADQTASMAILVTHIAASIGAFSWILIEWFRFGKPSLVGMATGWFWTCYHYTSFWFCRSARSNYTGCWWWILCYIAVDIIRIKLKIDDSLDVFAVHGVGGMLGTILCGILISSSWGGVGFDEGLLAIDHIKIQSYAVLVTIIWTVIVTYIILKIISLFTSLRVDQENEIEGLDTSTHGESGYNN